MSKDVTIASANEPEIRRETAPAEAAKPMRREKPAKRGFGIRSAILMLAGALVLVIVGFFVIQFGTSYHRSYDRWAEHARAVHDDGSVVTTPVRRQLADNEIELVIRNVDGRVQKVIADRSETDAFVNATITELQASREKIEAEIAADLDVVFSTAFADRGQAVERFADWFFEWKRSYVLLKEAVSAAFDDVLSANYETIEESVNNHIADYLMQHYRQFVLRPEFRDPIIEREVERVFARAHERYLGVVALQDLRLQLFLARNTTHLETLSGEAGASVTLDWDAQAWKAPLTAAKDRTNDGLTGLATIGAGGLIGSKVVWPLIRGRLATVYGSMVGRLTAGLTARIGAAAEGAAVGTAVEPGGGTIIGGLIGLVAGAGADWAANEWREKVDRPQFTADNNAAIDATIEVWKDKIKAGLNEAVGVWFDDTRTAVVIEKIVPEPPVAGMAADPADSGANDPAADTETAQAEPAVN